MSAPLGTFNSEERVQISTAIRLARQLPPGRERAPLSLSLSLCLLYSHFSLLRHHLSSSFCFSCLSRLYATSRVAFGIYAEEISSRVSSRGSREVDGYRVRR